MSDRTVLGTLLPGFAGPELPDWVDRMLREGLAGVCLFGENIVDAEQLRTLTAAIRAANPAAVIAVDEEGGDVTRLYYDRGSPYPGNAVLGRLDDVEATRATGAAVGRELAAAGIDLDLAPDADVNSNPRNPVIGIRSFGADPALVARHAAAWTEGLQSQGVAACVKHFPGHGDTAQDSHLALPSIEATRAVLEERELVPFEACVAAGAATVMTSHIRVPSMDPVNPATFSTAILGGLLRDRLAFEGVIVSDALDMAGASAETGIPVAAVRALAAGCDLLCIGTRNTEQQLREIVETVERAVEGGELAAARVEDAAARVAAMRQAVAAVVTAAGAGEGAPGPDRGSTADGAVPGPRSVADAFRIAPSVRETLRGSGSGSGSGGRGRWVVVRHDAVPNVAIGDVPWGPFDALEAADPCLAPVDAQAWWDGAVRIPADSSVLFVGRDNARRPEVAALLERLRARHDDVVTVDMGWPADDDTAQIATFGASALVGSALAELLLPLLVPLREPEAVSS